MPAIYVLDVPEFRTLVSVSEEREGYSVTKLPGGYFRIESPEKIEFTRKELQLKPAIWYGCVTGGLRWAEELRSIDRYLTIERARFGERLQVRLQVAPEVLPVGLPYLCLQPLVENAVRHGLSNKPGLGTVSIVARDAGAECHITVEDDGVGMDPSVFVTVGDALDDATDAGQHVGLTNVDERLRSVFGDEFGLVVETAPGSGTRVSMRVPKFHPDVRA